MDIRITGQLDDFERTGPSMGPNWAQTDSGAWGVHAMEIVPGGGAASHPSGFGSGDDYWTPAVFAGEGCEVWGYPSGGDPGAAGIAWALDLWQASSVGGSGAVDGYRFRVESSSGGSSPVLYRIDNTGSTLLDDSGSHAFSGAAEHVMLMKRVGDNIQCYISDDMGANWFLIYDITDTAYMGPYVLGIGIRDNSAGQILSWEGFGGGDRRHKTRIIRYVVSGRTLQV